MHGILITAGNLNLSSAGGNFVKFSSSGNRFSEYNCSRQVIYIPQTFPLADAILNRMCLLYIGVAWIAIEYACARPEIRGRY